MIGYALVCLGPIVSLIAMVLQANAPEHHRGSDGQLVQILTLNGIAMTLILAGTVVLVVQS